MSEVFFISDTHFRHKNIILLEPYYRPFKTIEEHDNELIKRWNKKVTNKDKVFHLGDFAMGSAGIEIAKELNGVKHLILGNHDTAPTSTYLKHFTKLHASLHYHEFLLTHIPIHPNSFRHATAIIHGHLHSKRVMTLANEVDPRYWNVSCEQISLAPISLDELRCKYGEKNMVKTREAIVEMGNPIEIKSKTFISPGYHQIP